MSQTNPSAFQPPQTSSKSSQCPHEAAIDTFIAEIKRGTFQNGSASSLAIAKRAAELIRNVLGNIHKTNMDELLRTVKRVGKQMADDGRPFGMVLENVTRRILYIIRDEYANILKENQAKEAGGGTGGSGTILSGLSSLRSSSIGGPPPFSLDGGDQSSNVGDSPLLDQPSLVGESGATDGVSTSWDSPSAPQTQPSPPQQTRIATTQPITIPATDATSSSQAMAGSPEESSYGSTIGETLPPEGLHCASPALSPLKRAMSTVNPNLHSPMEPISLGVQNNPNTQAMMWIKGKLKQNVILQINEYIQAELTDVSKNICDGGVDHLNDNEKVMTLGSSSIVETFLKSTAAKRKRTFEVLVAEHGPECRGHQMAKSLAQAGIKTTLITDASIYAMMCRVNKVIIGVHAVLANGGVVARSGTHMMALAAKAHRLPLIVLAGQYKLSPIFPINPLQFCDMASPSAVTPYESVFSSNGRNPLGSEPDKLRVLNPRCDYIPPNLIHVYITNNGVHSPSYIYRLLAELYNPEDYEL